MTSEAAQELLFAENEVLPPTSPKKFSILLIDKKVAASVYSKYHYFGDKDFLSSFSFGAIYEGEVFGAVTFGIPNAKNIKGLYSSDEQKGVLEITRMAFKPESPRNSCSRIISKAIKIIKKRYPLRLVITYADTAQGHDGTVYRASNFTYHGLTAKKTDFVFPDGSIKKVKGVKYSELEGQWVERSRKHLFSLRVA